MLRFKLLSRSGFLGALLGCLIACTAAPSNMSLQMPPLGEAEYHWIAARIFQNETNSKVDLLTYWGAGEDFPSMGIGHFIWFPEGVDAPFDETFPSMLNYVSEQSSACVSLPTWLQTERDAPWSAKAIFDAEQDSERMRSLRHWLLQTAPYQAEFIVDTFKRRWNGLLLEAGDKDALTVLLQKLLATPEGLFAVIDYYNFKGLGDNVRERYAGEGWGLVQVLRDIAASEHSSQTLVEKFSIAANKRLQRRVNNAPLERNERRWLAGWGRRVGDYVAPAPAPSRDTISNYRVPPYQQQVSATGARIVWFSESGNAGELQVEEGASQPIASAPTLACELAYHLSELRHLDAARALPYRHEVVLDHLTPGKTYSLLVRQDGEQKQLTLRTPSAEQVEFIVYADSETEPESRVERVAWPRTSGDDRRYLLNQTAGYTANLAAIAESKPDFIAIAGDLVESGGEQRDWDEFWRHNADIAAATPIVPALGNHEYFGGPGDLGGYSRAGAQRALAKYTSYFDRPPYYLVEQGPIALIVLDVNNGQPERSASDTNWYLNDVAPRWQTGSRQREWLLDTLAKAQQTKAFTFVMFHPAPYTTGIHGLPPGTGAGENFSSGWPLRELTPLFMRYGVDAVFSGHDEMYEHSVVPGEEIMADGLPAAHRVHFFTVGIGGDGLRGAEPGVENPYRVFSADQDSQEIYSEDGVLQDGGKHYGHLRVVVDRGADGSWEARFTPVYVFPTQGSGDARSWVFETRQYDDRLSLRSDYVD